MDELDRLIDGIATPGPTGQPVPSPVSPITTNSVSRNWLLWLFVAGLGIAFCFFQLKRINSDDDSKPVVVDQPHVVILEETSERDKLTSKQIAIFSSVELRKYCDENDVVIRKYDTDDDLSKESKQLQELRDMLALSPPAVIVAKGRNATQFKLPADPAAMLSKVKQLTGGK